MSDIVERLMRFSGKVCLSTDTEVEAADEIERLRTENAKLREAELIFSKDGQKWRTAISIFKEQDAKIDKLENIIEDDAKLILRVRMENEKLRAALKPFADVAENDICDSLTDADIFRPITREYSRAAMLTCGDLRAAAAALNETDNG